MIYVLLSVCFSVIVSVMLKLARRYQIDVYQAVTWNYSMAILLTWVFLKPQLQNLGSAPFILYGLLGILLPLLFIIMAAAVRLTGIVRTDVAQRLSLFIPVLSSFLLFGELASVVKIIGIVIGFAAIACSFSLTKQTANRRVPANSWIYLLAVFLGMGIIDILLRQVGLSKEVTFGTSLFLVFLLAFLISFAGLLYQVFTKRMKFSWPHILIGWALGVANFANILCYIKAHQTLSKTPSTVFTSVNIGIILLGTLTGIFIFKEKLSTINKAGIALAMLAIVINFYADQFTHLFARIF